MKLRGKLEERPVIVIESGDQLAIGAVCVADGIYDFPILLTLRDEEQTVKINLDVERATAFALELLRRLAPSMLKDDGVESFLASLLATTNGDDAKSAKLAARTLHYYNASETTILLKEQCGRCAICTDRITYGDFVVDHDHETGFIRGLLCRSCNVTEPFSSDPRVIAYRSSPPARERWLYLGRRHE